MKIRLAALTLFLASSNIHATTECTEGKWVHEPIMKDKILVTKIKGSCTTDQEGDLERLKEHYLSNLIVGPEVQEVHNVDNQSSIEEIPAVEVDLTSFSSTKDGDLEQRVLAQVGTDEGKLISNRKTTQIISATRNSKYVKDLSDELVVSKTAEGFKVEYTSEVHLKIPKLFKKAAAKGVKETFDKTIEEVGLEVADNL